MSWSPARERALLRMLAEGSLAECENVIVYCTRRDECERLATMIRTQLQTRDLGQAKSAQVIYSTKYANTGIRRRPGPGSRSLPSLTTPA